MGKRTTYCGLVTEELLGQKVTLKGWVHNRRFRWPYFVDLRDREELYKLYLIQIFQKKLYLLLKL